MAKNPPANRSETFGRLLSGMVNSIASYEGKSAAIIEEELGASLNVVGKTVQRYKAGYLPPNDQTVRLLAEAGVRRGFLGREWLQRFLHAARYPFAEKLLDELCPAPQVRPRPPRIYENLPAPTYSQFVMRQQAFTEVSDGLGKRTAAVLIVGMGGNGKTSLAREVAAHSLRESADLPRFDAVVWVSDKDRPGTTNLTTVLDEIARTLDYPGFTQFEHDEKRREVEQLLRRQRVLLVVDNFETITDGALLTWLLNLPEPSKALITSRERHRGLWSSWLVELRGMMEAEAWELISERAQVLKIERLVSERAHLELLLAVTGGNPKALSMALGLLKYERRPLQDVVDDLYAARGELFDDLFTRAWALLDEAARRVLLVATFFPTSVSGDALRATADVQGFAFDRAIERLADMALLDVQQAGLSSSPRYLLHPLVRAFASAKLAEQVGFEAQVRERWVGWYVQLIGQMDHIWGNLDELALLEAEHETATAVLTWAFQHQHFQEILQLTPGVGYYYYLRGPWDRKLSIEQMCADAAHAVADISAEVRALSYSVQIFCRQDNRAAAESYLVKAQELAQSTRLAPESFFALQDAQAFYSSFCGNFDEAQKIWEQSLAYAVRHYSESQIYLTRTKVIIPASIATCLYNKGLRTKAKQEFGVVLENAKRYNYKRSMITTPIWLARMELDEGCLDSAKEILAESRDGAYYYQDRRSIADIEYVTARLHTLRGDIPAARASLAEAIDLFERLGMRRELAEARQTLADLDAGAAAGEATTRA